MPKQNKTIKYRSLYYCPFSNTSIGTILPQLIDCPFISYEEAKNFIGQVVIGEISKIDANNGLTIKFNNSISGFIPLDHLSDIKISADIINKKYKLSRKLRCQILNVDCFKNRITLTCKKSLVESKLSPLIDVNLVKNLLKTKQNGIKDGTLSISKEKAILKKLTANAIITNLTADFINIVYYNNIYGFIPKRFLNEIGVDNAKKFYNKGQTIRTVVQSVTRNKNDEEMLVASLYKPSSEDAGKEDSSQSKDNTSTFTPGQTFTAKVTSKNDVENYLSLKIKSQQDKKSRESRIYKNHLSDFESISDIMFANAKIGTVFNEVIAISRNVLTLKESFRRLNDVVSELEAENEDIEQFSFSEKHENRNVLGFISCLDPLNVTTINFKTGYVPKKYTADEFVSEQSTYYKLGQTVIANIKEATGQPTNKLILSLKASDSLDSTSPVVINDLISANQSVIRFYNSQKYLLKSYLNCFNSVVEDLPEDTQENFKIVKNFNNSDCYYLLNNKKKFILSKRSHINDQKCVEFRENLYNLIDLNDSSTNYLTFKAHKGLKLAIIEQKNSQNKAKNNTKNSSLILEADSITSGQGKIVEIKPTHLKVKNDKKTYIIHVFDTVENDSDYKINFKSLKDRFKLDQSLTVYYADRTDQEASSNIRASLYNRPSLKHSTKFSQSHFTNNSVAIISKMDTKSQIFSIELKNNNFINSGYLSAFNIYKEISKLNDYVKNYKVGETILEGLSYVGEERFCLGQNNVEDYEIENECVLPGYWSGKWSYLKNKMILNVKFLKNIIPDSIFFNSLLIEKRKHTRGDIFAKKYFYNKSFVKNEAYNLSRFSANNQHHLCIKV